MELCGNLSGVGVGLAGLAIECFEVDGLLLFTLEEVNFDRIVAT